MGTSFWSCWRAKAALAKFCSKGTRMPKAFAPPLRKARGFPFALAWTCFKYARPSALSGLCQTTKVELEDLWLASSSKKMPAVPLFVRLPRTWTLQICIPLKHGFLVEFLDFPLLTGVPRDVNVLAQVLLRVNRNSAPTRRLNKCLGYGNPKHAQFALRSLESGFQNECFLWLGWANSSKGNNIPGHDGLLAFLVHWRKLFPVAFEFVITSLEHHPNFSFAIMDTGNIKQSRGFAGILGLDPLSIHGFIVLELSLCFSDADDIFSGHVQSPWPWFMFGHATLSRNFNPAILLFVALMTRVD